MAGPMTPINCPKPNPHKPHGKAVSHDHCPNAGILWPVAAPNSTSR